ncbi:hypothetical protein LTS18_010549 [Coniosporium uncinatum]|uniref:Uncharacterized protein n=1 Tax=Coniosporium uncinatum TaxID=93489 RepID=A0ACC3DKV1_9PEZI|nr:hypothetical protein LTS18_010549 [Coniosporium uncinatum]
MDMKSNEDLTMQDAGSIMLDSKQDFNMNSVLNDNFDFMSNSMFPFDDMNQAFSPGIFGDSGPFNPFSPEVIQSIETAAPADLMFGGGQPGHQMPLTPPLSTGANSVASASHSHIAQTSPSRSEQAGSQSGCQCFQNAILILEELEATNRRMDVFSLDCVCKFQKDVLGHCNIMLECERCKNHSANFMLLAFIGEKLAFSFEKAANKCEEQARVDQKINEQKAAMARPGELERRESYSSNMSLGEYECNDPQEWSHLMRMLLLIQLKRLGGVIGRLKGIATHEKRETQLLMLAETERKTRGIATELMKTERANLAHDVAHQRTA